ncbi:hypothetical protein [Paenibacillus sp. BT-177]|uniref:hypothetical protein n=1 Tax=Paenibacillus sp. BT-177 TaxID=2986930 RepID=UPI000FA6C6FE|nr:hypothetical protein [Paenibacillus sp. BT-177]
MNWIILFLFIMVLILVILEVPQFLWVNKFLKSPFRRYKKSVKTDGQFHYQLNKKTNTFVEYYKNYDTESLEKLRLDILIKKQRFTIKKQSSSFMTSGGLSVMSVGIALFSLSVRAGNQKNGVMESVPYFGMLAVIFCLIFFTYYTSETFILNPLDAHLLIIEEELDKRNKSND